MLEIYIMHFLYFKSIPR